MAWPYTNESYDEVVRANDLRFDINHKNDPALTDLLQRTFDRLLETASADLKAAVAAGVQIEYLFEQIDGGGTRIICRTKNPCGVVWVDGKATVYEQKPE